MTSFRLYPIVAGIIMAAAACSAAAQQAAPSVKVGFVNMERVMRDAVPAQRAQKSLEGEIQKRDLEMRRLTEQLKRLQAELDKMPATAGDSERRTKERSLADLGREFERKKVVYTEDLEARRNEAMGQVIEQANRAVRQVAEQGNFDIIFQEAAYMSQRIDITDQVIRALDAIAKAAAK